MCSRARLRKQLFALPPFQEALRARQCPGQTRCVAPNQPTQPHPARRRQGSFCGAGCAALLAIDPKERSGYGSRGMPENEKKAVVFTLTNELFLPSRLVYRVSDRALLERKLAALPSIDWDPFKNRWTWLYENEAKSLGWPAAYDRVPPERQPILLAACHLIGQDRMDVYLRSCERVVKFLQFFDRHIPHDCALGEFIDGWNRVSVARAGEPLATPEEFFRNESRIEFVNFATLQDSGQLKGEAGLAFLQEQSQRVFPELERHRLEMFYAEGPGEFARVLRFRETLAMLQHRRGGPIRPYEVIQDLMRNDS